MTGPVTLRPSTNPSVPDDVFNSCIQMTKHFTYSRAYLFMKQARVKDTLLMAIAIELSIIGTEPNDGSLLPLLFIGVLITAIVIIKEAVRRLSEY